jgi:hypothetical protein
VISTSGETVVTWKLIKQLHRLLENYLRTWIRRNKEFLILLLGKKIRLPLISLNFFFLSRWRVVDDFFVLFRGVLLGLEHVLHSFIFC